jgi:hypothetical protein
MYPTLYALIDFLRQLFELLLRLHKLPTSVDVAIWVHLFEVVVQPYLDINWLGVGVVCVSGCITRIIVVIFKDHGQGCRS